MFFPLYLSIAQAHYSSDSSAQIFQELRLNEFAYLGSQSHGPEKPPPDDGYDFKGAKGGNAFGKLGLLMIGAGTVTGVMTLRAEKESQKRQSLLYTTGGLWVGGLTFLIIERAS